MKRRKDKAFIALYFYLLYNLSAVTLKELVLSGAFDVA